MQPDLASLTSRLERLERGRRRARAAVAAAVLCLAAVPSLAFLSQAPQDSGKAAAGVVRGTTFELVDGEGRVRGRLGFDKDGGPELRLFDVREKVRVRLGIHKDAEPLLTLVDEEDKNRVALVYDGNPHFVMSRPGGKPVIHMTSSPSGDASLLFIHIDGHQNAAIGIRGNGDAVLIQSKSPPEAERGK